MTKYSPVQYHDAEQGSEEWHQLRCGILTASQVSQIVTPTLKLASNDNSRALANKIAIQRITGISEETYTTEKMLRGHIDEDVARELYHEKYDHVTQVGFITNDQFPNFGYSPDGVVGERGLIEIKSRDPHLHMATIAAWNADRVIPKEYMAQIQSGLLISNRDWCDFISFSHGLPMLRARVERDGEYIAAIRQAAEEFEKTVLALMDTYRAATSDPEFFTPTERIDYEGMML